MQNSVEEKHDIAAISRYWGGEGEKKILFTEESSQTSIVTAAPWALAVHI